MIVLFGIIIVKLYMQFHRLFAFSAIVAADELNFQTRTSKHTLQAAAG
jgi:hypothetical protein